VLAVWPFGNIVALAEVDGPTLKAILDNGVREIGGGRFVQLAGLRVDYYIDESVAPADNGGFPRGVIERAEYFNHPEFADGTPIDLSASSSYTIALNDFMTVGGDGYPVLGDAVYSLQDPLEIAVERYLLGNSPVNPKIEGRVLEIEKPEPDPVPVLTTKEQCLGGGWQAFTELGFKNQGQCVRSVASSGRNVRAGASPR
jgi:5'-nucleotidase